MFDCSMLVTKDRVEGAHEGECEWKWRPVQCWSPGADGATGDRDDYKTLVGFAWPLENFRAGDRVYLVDCDVPGKGPMKKGWFAREQC